MYMQYITVYKAPSYVFESLLVTSDPSQFPSNSVISNKLEH